MSERYKLVESPDCQHLFDLEGAVDLAAELRDIQDWAESTHIITELTR